MTYIFRGETCVRLQIKIEKDFKVFINECDLIIANRMSKELNEFSDKVFTRDLFGND